MHSEPPPFDLDQELNPDQAAAVTHGEGPQLVLAGAGSGKTRVITYRIAWLIREQGVDPSRVVAVTFTNKAAAEMRERVEDLLGLRPTPAFVGTFHRYALVLLRRYGERVGLQRDFAIFDSTDQRTLIKQALNEEGIPDKSFRPAAVLGAISAAKNRLQDPDAYEAEADSFFARRIAPVYRRYQGLLRQASAVDFDDMIALAVRLLDEDEELRETIRWRTQFLLVDEFQDTNHAQLRLISQLLPAGGNLTAVGDEDQGIYSWRGAELGNILDFEKVFPGAVVRKLERNYRSTQNILDASGAVVANNQNRRGKTLWTDSGAGELIEIYKAADEKDEAGRIVRTMLDLRSRHRLEEMAILVRTNAQTRVLEDELLKREIPYQLVGGVRFYERAEVKDLVAYLRLLRNPRDGYSLMRVINQPPRGIGKTTIDRLQEMAVNRGQPLWDVIYNDELSELPARSSSAVRRFRDLMVNLQRLSGDLRLGALLEQLLEATGYLDLYREDDPEGQAKRENVKEFLSAAQELGETGLRRGESDELTAFLDHVSLVTDLDTAGSAGGVLLMTLHSAKGLEFPVIFLAGLEDGLLPHFNSQGVRDDLEEERRLLYVGMTRARERLFLSCCRRRRIAGYYQDQQESPFLSELPEDLVRVTESPTLFQNQRVRGVYSFFGKQAEGGAGRGQSGDRTREPMDDGSEIRKGTRVRHPVLGEGTVLEIEGSGDRSRITVYFDAAGKRKLLGKYAKLQPA